MYTECLTADATLKANAASKGTTTTEGLVANTSVIEDWFATTPAFPVALPYQAIDEEALHTSFEHAISGRLIAVNRRLNFISGPLSASQQVCVQITRPLHQAYLPSSDANEKQSPRTEDHVPSKSLETTWQRSLLLGSLALMFLLVGFDIMGLLVLHAH